MTIERASTGNCAELERLLAETRDGDEEAGITRIERHLESCKDCARAETWLNDALREYQHSDARRLDDAFERAIMNQLCLDP